MYGPVRLLRGYQSGGMPGNVTARGLIPFGGGLGATLQQFAWPEGLQSFLFALQWTMFSTNVTIYHHLISQAGWNRCYLSRMTLQPSPSDVRESHPTLTISSSLLRALWDLPGDVLAGPASALCG